MCILNKSSRLWMRAISWSYGVAVLMVPTLMVGAAVPDSSAPQNPVMDKWLGYRPIQQEIRT